MANRRPIKNHLVKDLHGVIVRLTKPAHEALETERNLLNQSQSAMATMLLMERLVQKGYDLTPKPKPKT